MQRDEDEDEGRLTIQKRSNGSEHTMDQRPRQYNGAYNRLLTGVHALVFPVVPPARPDPTLPGHGKG